MLATLAALGAGAVAAVGQGAPRQTATAVFDQTRPGSATGARLEIHYRDPEDPAAKPPAVSLVVINLPAGTAIDTSAPASCEASDAELMAQGPSACPPDSRVGGGRVTLDTGLAGDGRMPSGPTTLLNAADELIMLVELDGSARAVARIEGSRLTTEVPPVPGGPADGFTAPPASASASRSARAG